MKWHWQVHQSAALWIRETVLLQGCVCVFSHRICCDPVWCRAPCRWGRSLAGSRSCSTAASCAGSLWDDRSPWESRAAVCPRSARGARSTRPASRTAACSRALWNSVNPDRWCREIRRLLSWCPCKCDPIQKVRQRTCPCPRASSASSTLPRYSKLTDARLSSPISLFIHILPVHYQLDIQKPKPRLTGIPSFARANLRAADKRAWLQVFFLLGFFFFCHCRCRGARAAGCFSTSAITKAKRVHTQVLLRSCVKAPGPSVSSPWRSVPSEHAHSYHYSLKPLKPDSLCISTAHTKTHSSVVFCTRWSMDRRALPPPTLRWKKKQVGLIAQVYGRVT